MDQKYIFFFGANNEYGFLSNWYESSFQPSILDRRVSCAEQGMMLIKAAVFDDGEAFDKIANATKPAECKAIGRTIKNFNPVVWNELSTGLVYSILINKFLSSQDLFNSLISTGDKILVEASPYDRIWGIGYDKNTALDNIDNWGENRLGKCLMYVRESIKPKQ